MGPSAYRPKSDDTINNLDLVTKFSIQFGCMDLICCRLHRNKTNKALIKSLSPRFLVDEILGEIIRGNLSQAENQFLYDFENDYQAAVFSNVTFVNYDDILWSADLALLVNDREANVLRRFYKMLDEKHSVLRDMKTSLKKIQLVTIIHENNERNWCFTGFESRSCLKVVSSFDFETPTCPQFQVTLY